MTKYITLGDFDSGTFHYLVGDELVPAEQVLEVEEAEVLEEAEDVL